MRTGRWSWAFAVLLLALGCGGGSSGTPDAGDVPEDQMEAGDGVDVDDDGGGDADADDDGGADADADDDGGGDADDDGGADGDADATPKHTVISLTAGGGRAATTDHQLTLSIGTPQPMGAAQSGANRVQVGPGAVVNQ